MSDDSDLLSDDVKAVAESFLIAGVHPNLRLVAEAAIRADALKREFIETMLRSLALESQNQALQEELATTQEAYRFKSREADANGRLAEDAIGAVELAESRLRGHETCACGHTLCQHEPRSFGCADLHGPCALSPTQETDEPDCTRCGNERTVGGYGTDERFPCPVCRHPGD